MNVSFPSGPVSRFSIPRSFRALVAASSLLIPLGSAVAETASAQVAALSEKLTELLAAKPDEAGETLSHFANRIVNPDGGKSLATQLSDKELLQLASDMGKAIPATVKNSIRDGIKTRVDKKVLEIIRPLEKSLAGMAESSGDPEAILPAAAEIPDLQRLLAVARNPAHKDRRGALLTRVDGGWQTEQVDATGGMRLRGTARGGQYVGSTFFIVQEVSPSPPASDPR